MYMSCPIFAYNINPSDENVLAFNCTIMPDVLYSLCVRYESPLNAAVATPSTFSQNNPSKSNLQTH